MSLTERVKMAAAAFMSNRDGPDVRKEQDGPGVVEKSASRSMSEWIELARFLGIDPENNSPETTYFQCLRVLGETIGKLPCKLMKRGEGGGSRPVLGSRVAYKVSTRPNSYTSATMFWNAVERQRNHYGNAVVWIDGYGSGMNLWLLDWPEVDVWYDDAKLLRDISDIWYVYSHGGSRVVLSSREVMHFKTSNTLDGIVGIPVIETLSSLVDGRRKSQSVLNGMYDKGMAQKLAVQYTGSLSDENAVKFAKGIEEYLNGNMRQKGIEHVLLVPPGSSVTPLDMKLTDAQFLEISKHSALEIAGAFGLKPTQINDYEKASYSSQEQQQLAFYVDTLLFIVKQYEDEITDKLLLEEERESGMFFRFNVNAILRADQQTQMNTLVQAVSNFVRTPNEARDLLDLPSVPGGDTLIGNGSTIPIGMVGDQYRNDAGKEGGE